MTDVRISRSIGGVRAGPSLLDLGADGTVAPRKRRCLAVRREPFGVEINRAKVRTGAQAAGRPCTRPYFTQLDPQSFPAVKVVVFDNVLEHLPSLDAVETSFDRACAMGVARSLLRHPSFEDEDYLRSLELKHYWTDWPGCTPLLCVSTSSSRMSARNGVLRLHLRAAEARVRIG